LCPVNSNCPCHRAPCQIHRTTPNGLKPATDQAIAACGGDACEAVRALIVANEYLESEVCELMHAVSHAYVRGRFKAYTG
jgi:hypothetical protein